MKLLIVESPTKARKIQGYLGAGWKVMACLGHVRDLPATKDEVPEKYRALTWARLGVNTAGGYAPLYVVRPGKQAKVRELRAAAQAADEVFLAADPDREGESIAWHLSVLLGLKEAQRVTYQEITPAALRHAVAHPRPLDLRLVAAQETRRTLDRLAGYGVSPLLWAALGGAQSAGRVQSAALQLLAQREQARLAFVPSAYWRVTARVTARPAFQAAVTHVRGTPLATASSFTSAGHLKPDVTVTQLDATKAGQLVTYLNGRPAEVTHAEVTPVTRRPPPPFTTSTLQQAANARLKLGAAEVTRLAQGLYENGLITYMRTDSPALSDEALTLARAAVEARFGAAALPAKPRQYATRNANAQEAHEAIRPAGAFLAPPQTRLGGNELALYTLIYERTVASQMLDAVGEKTTLTLQAGVVTLEAAGTRLTQPGFTALYDDEVRDQEDQTLPLLEVGSRFPLTNAKAEEKRSPPPARFTEGKFVQVMEKAGIGRPSTFGHTLETLQKRGYVALRRRQLHVTPLGLMIAAYLQGQVPQVVDTAFTAGMEADLDRIAHGELTRVAYLDRVWKAELAPAIERATRAAPTVTAPHVPVVFTSRAGQVHARIGAQVVQLPPEVLLEDLTPDMLPALASGSWTPGPARAARGSSQSRAKSGATIPARKKAASGAAAAERRPRRKKTSA